MAELAHGTPRAGRGRPRIDIDYRLLERLARHGFAIPEMAPFLKMSERTFRARLKDDARFREIVEDGFANAVPSLVRLQTKRAQGGGRGAVKAAIWLSKHLLSEG